MDSQGGVLARSIRFTMNFLAIGLAVFAIIVSAIGVFDMVVVSGLTAFLGLTIALIRLEDKVHDTVFQKTRLFFHAVMVLSLLYLFLEWGQIMFEQEEAFIVISQRQNMFAWIAVVIIGYMAYRLFGITMLLFLLLVTGYLLLPERMGGAGEDWIRAIENLWFSSDGVFGRPVEVVSRIVLIFIVFGAILQQSGAGEILLRFSLAMTGSVSGGPAHAAIAASALFGSLSGTAIANVVSTGVFTIPIIKKAGFKPSFAGAVEAAASTGGQIMPPVMGVVAFLMADITGIPYLTIVIATIIPSLMYYGSLFLVVYVESKKMGIKPIPVKDRIKLTLDDGLKSLTFIVPLSIIVAVLVTGRTAQNAGFFGMVSAFVLCLIFFPKFRHPKKWFNALVDAGKTSAVLMVVVAAIGFVIGAINMSGISLMFAEKVLSIASSNIGMALVFVMISCLIMGMGVPTGAAYLMIAIVLGPVLNGLGLSLLASHLFVVYFGVLSVVTPPVALAAFAAAPIANASPFETGMEATRLSIAGFIIPYIFVFHPDILLVLDGFSIGGLIWAIIVFILAIWSITTAIGGWEFRVLPIWQRFVRLGSAILLIIPGVPTALIAFCLLITCILANRFAIRNIQGGFINKIEGGS